MGKGNRKAKGSKNRVALLFIAAQNPKVFCRTFLDTGITECQSQKDQNKKKCHSFNSKGNLYIGGIVANWETGNPSSVNIFFLTLRSHYQKEVFFDSTAM